MQLISLLYFWIGVILADLQVVLAISIYLLLYSFHNYMYTLFHLGVKDD